MEGMFIREKKALEDQYVKYKENWVSLFPQGMRMDDGTLVPLEELLTKLVYQGLESDIKNLEIAHSKASGRTHHWIGINPPSNKYTLLELANAMQDVTAKYKMFEVGYGG